MQRVPTDLGVVLGLPESAVVRVPVLALAPGVAGAARLDGLGDAAVVVHGMLVRTIAVRQRVGALLHGPGDVLASAVDEPGPFVARTRALSETRLAVLDEPALREIAATPRLAGALAERLAAQSDRAGLQTILMQLPSIEERLVAMLPELCQRLGTVTAAGVTLPAYLSHTVLAALVGVRRPSLTTAVATLDDDGRLRRLPDRRWLLAPELAGLMQAA